VGNNDGSAVGSTDGCNEGVSVGGLLRGVVGFGEGSKVGIDVWGTEGDTEGVGVGKVVLYIALNPED
jgi:hypothetical protein